MDKRKRKASPGTLRIKGALRGVAVSRTECDEHGHRSVTGGVFANKNDFMRFILAHYWGKPTNLNGGDT